MEQACADYGQALGTAFQVIDDVLDYDGEAGEMGKNLGDDLREGKATLPLIAAMQRGTAEQRDIIRNAIETGGVERAGSHRRHRARKPGRWRSRATPRRRKRSARSMRRASFRTMPTARVCYNWRLNCCSAATDCSGSRRVSQQTGCSLAW